MNNVVRVCLWCGRIVPKEEVIISTYGYPVCSPECKEEIDREEHSYSLSHDPDNAISSEDLEI